MAAEEGTTLVKFKLVSGGPPFELTVESEATIASIRTLVAEKCDSAPVAAIRLIYKGKILKDAETLTTHSFKNGETFIVRPHFLYYVLSVSLANCLLLLLLLLLARSRW